MVEELSIQETAEVMAGAGLGSLEEWVALTADADLIRDLAPQASSLEGYLFPDTYNFFYDETPRSVIKALTRRAGVTSKA